MRIGIDSDSLNNDDGIGTFAKCLLEIIKNKHGIKIFYLSEDCYKPNLVERILIKFEKLIRIFKRTYFNTYFESQLLPKIIQEKKIQIYHTFDGTLPQKPNCITVQTCLDLSYHYEKNYLSKSLVNYYEMVVKKSAKSATHIIAISESTKKDLIKIWKIPENKISVVYLGVDKNKYSCSEISKEIFYQKTGINYKYLLSVGNLNSRKNGIRLIEAFQIINSKYPLLKLIFIGSSGNDELKMKFLVNKYDLSSRIFFIGRVDSSMLVAYYQNAEVFCYPSIHEGFGLPILEAMASGTPVLTSDSSSMKEISGKAAVLVNPFDISSIADGIEYAIQNRNNLVNKGLEHIKKYTWEHSAEKIVSLYQLLLRKYS